MALPAQAASRNLQRQMPDVAGRSRPTAPLFELRKLAEVGSEIAAGEQKGEADDRARGRDKLERPGMDLAEKTRHQRMLRKPEGPARRLVRSVVRFVHRVHFPQPPSFAARDRRQMTARVGGECI